MEKWKQDLIFFLSQRSSPGAPVSEWLFQKEKRGEENNKYVRSEGHESLPYFKIPVSMQCNGQKYSHYIACYWKMGTREDTSDLSTATTKEQCETMWNIKILKNSTPSQLQI